MASSRRSTTINRGRDLSREVISRARIAARRGIVRLGYDVRRIQAPEWADLDEERLSLCAEVQPYTLTSRERIVTLADAVEYVVRRGIPGDFVECGVWMGGSAMVIAKTLVRLGVRDRGIWLYDTFGAMPDPDESARELDLDFADQPPPPSTSSVPHGVYVPRVRANVESTGYPADRITCVSGMVEETIPGSSPRDIALLRLDTDWYSSTAHELEHLYPRLATGGVLVIDDYGHFKGARKAVDEYSRTPPSC